MRMRQQVKVDMDQDKAANKDRKEIVTQQEQEQGKMETMSAKATEQAWEEGVATQQEQEQRKAETKVEEQQAELELDKEQAKAADHGGATQQEQEQRKSETMVEEQQAELELDKEQAKATDHGGASQHEQEQMQVRTVEEQQVKDDQEQKQEEIMVEGRGAWEGRKKEPPTQQQSNCVVRGKPAAARRKEQGRKITDLIRGFNAMTDDDRMTGGRNRILNSTPKVVVEQTMTKKRKACDVVEQLDVDRKAGKKKSRTSCINGSLRSEKEISINNYFKTNIFVRSGVPVGELHSQGHVPVQGGDGVNPVQGEGRNFQPSVNPDVTASQYCEAADDKVYSGARYASNLV